MLESSLMASLLGAGKGAATQFAKEFVKDWMADTLRITRAIRKTSATFSTQLPGAENALRVWVESEPFRAALEQLIIGTLPGQIAAPEEFVAATGLSFGTASLSVVKNLLEAFFSNIREDLVSSAKGLTLVDNRLGEVLREVREVHAELPVQAGSKLSYTTLQNASAVLNQIAQIPGWGKNLGYGAEIRVNLDVPPAVQSLASRTSTVDRVRGALDRATWYAVHGGSGSGKTQLAILIARSFIGRKVWLRLGGDLATAGMILESALNMISIRQPGQSVQKWCDSVCAVLESESVIVFDDLPSTLGKAATDECLVALCAACSRSGVRLLSTSGGPLAPITRDVLGNLVHEEVAPSFSDEDIRELFRAYGASEQYLASRWFQFVQSASKRHPMLLAEAARYLQARKWATDDRSFEDFAKGTFARSLDGPTIEQVRQTVPDPTSRDFLYRLKLIGSPFGIEDIERVSSVPPVISLPLEHLATLTGLWIQQDTEREYVISPLLARLPDANITKALQQAIHIVLARGIVEKKRLGPIEVSQAASHFVSGGDADSAALVVLMAWDAMLKLPHLSDPIGLTSLWAGMALPEGISPEKRIYLRTVQVILRRRFSQDDQFELADLEHLLNQVESNDDYQLITAVSGALLGTYLGERDPSLAIRSVSRGIKAFRLLSKEKLSEPELAMDAGLLGLLWAMPAWIRTNQQYAEWFAAIRQLTPGEIRVWAELPLADQGSEVVSGGIWTREVDLAGSAHDWSGVEMMLQGLHAWASSAGVVSLAMSALRNQIIVAAEYGEDLVRADSLARAGMEEFHEIPRALFLIAETIARQHYLFGSDADAVRWFHTAFDHIEAVPAPVRISSLTLAGVVAQALDTTLGVGYLEQGVSMSTADGVSALIRVTVRGELGILLWSSAQRKRAFSVWDVAAKQLLAAREETKTWKTMFMLFGNCTGYFLKTSRGTQPPNGEMTVPFPGIFLREVKDIDGLHKREQEWLLPVQMSLLAESIGAYEKAIEWAKRAEVGSGPMAVAAEALLSSIQLAGELPVHDIDAIVSGAAIGDLDEPQNEPALLDLDEPRRARAVARTVAQLRLVALTIEIARLGLKDSASAQAMAQTAAQLSRQSAASHIGSQNWSGIAEAFEALAARNGSWRELWSKAVAASARSATSLHAMYGIAASIVAGPKEAVQIQLQIVPCLEQMLSATLYHATVSKFVREYWPWAMDQFPMSFGLLHRTQKKIADALELDDRASVHAILEAAAFSLGVAYPDHVRGWLVHDADAPS